MSHDALIRGMVEAFSESGEKAVPMATEDASEVLKAQLTENTGRHLLDSGGAYGRHWEDNQDNPPWDDPRWNVYDSFVTQNVYHYLNEKVTRSASCVHLEIALYAFGYSDEYARTAWLRTEEAFAQTLLDGEVGEITKHADLPGEVIDTLEAVSAEVGSSDGPTTFNSYNSEFEELSQVIQTVNLGGPYAEYALVQIHQGADVRGGYTAPRVYTVEYDTLWTGELSFYCESCRWSNAESCCWDDDNLLFQSTIDPSELVEEGWLPDDEQDEPHPALDAAYSNDGIDGAIFHRCEDEPGYFGHVLP